MNVKEYIREEARQEGRQEGIQQNIQQVVLNMLKEKNRDRLYLQSDRGFLKKEIKKLKNGA